MHVAPGAVIEPTSRPVPLTSVARLLCDRLVPCLLFGTVTWLRAAGLISAAQRSPSEAELFAWLSYVLNVAHGTLAVLFLALITTLFMVRRAPKGGRAGPLPMAIALLGTFVMYLVAGQPSTTEDWRVLLAADLLIAGGLAFTVYAVASLRYCFGLAPEARGLVTTGAYRLVRHPVYLGEFVAFLGMLLPIFAPSTALIFGLFCLLQTARACLEERVLAATFAEYGAYRRQTPSLLPWPRP